MLAKRIIPCLDVKDGRVVKGRRFERLRYAGDPVALAERYYLQGADEIFFLDISASAEKRGTMLGVAERTQERVFIPFAVGGGIRSVFDIRRLLNAGADKIAINTAAVENPKLVTAAAHEYGSQCVVVAIDAKRVGSRYEVFTYGGRVATGIDAVQWAKKAESLGAGEILLTSIDRDGTNAGYDIALTRLVADATRIPVIASGGAGSAEHVREAFAEGHADAALLAGQLHYGALKIPDVKGYLAKNGVRVRL